MTIDTAPDYEAMARDIVSPSELDHLSIYDRTYLVDTIAAALRQAAEAQVERDAMIADGMDTGIEIVLVGRRRTNKFKNSNTHIAAALRAQAQVKP